MCSDGDIRVVLTVRLYQVCIVLQTAENMLCEPVKDT